MGRGEFVLLAMAFVGLTARGEAEETKASPVATSSTGSESKPDSNPPILAEPEGSTPIRVRVPVRVPVTHPKESAPEGTNESSPPVRSSTGFRTELRELPFPRPSAEEEAKLRQELKEALQRKVDSLSVEGLMEEVYREREASREAEAWKKLQRLREELDALENEFPGTAAADDAARMQGAVLVTPEPAPPAPPKTEAPVPSQQEERKVEALPRAKEPLAGPTTHPLTLNVGSGVRRAAVRPRALGQDPIILGGITPDPRRSERVITMTRGVRIVIEEAPVKGEGSHGIQIEAERAVLWTDSGRADEVRGIEIDDNTRFQLYLEGDVVIHQGGHVTNASSAYYDVHERHGRFTKEEIGTNLRESEAGLRIRGIALREKAQNKHARTSEVERAFEAGEGAKILNEKEPAARKELDAPSLDALEANPGKSFLDSLRPEGENPVQETAPGIPL